MQQINYSICELFYKMKPILNFQKKCVLPFRDVCEAFLKYDNLSGTAISKILTDKQKILLLYVFIIG